MKLKLNLIIGAMVLSAFEVSGQGTIHDLDFDVQKSDISVVDIDGDGDRDILIIGENPDGRYARLHSNDTDFAFTLSASPFAGSALTTTDWGDVNGDGYLDVVQSGFAADSIVTNLFRSDSEGVFSEDYVMGDFVHMAPSIGMADLNNDGYTDIYVFGNHFEGKPQLYFNNKAGVFTAEAQFDAYQFIDPQVSEVDIDNDGDMDLFVMAGYEVGIDARFARLFINDRGVFTVSDPGIIAKGFGHSEWGDYDSDGDLDLLLNGDGWVNSGEDNDHIYRLYKNTNGALAEVTTFTTYRQSNVGDGSRFADWDNDGDLDVIITGWNDGAERQATAIYLNNTGIFTEYEGNASLPGVSESAVEVGDLDNDGDLDLIIGGFSGNNWDGDSSAYNRNISVIIENTTAGVNEAPGSPTNLNVVASGTDVTFSWDEATDDKTASKSLTYNFFLVDSNGNYLYYPLADTTNGYLTIQEKGNVQLNNTWKVYGLPFGKYRWGVQAVDNSFSGSIFAKTDFDHKEGGPLNVGSDRITQTLVYPNPANGTFNIRVSQDMLGLAIYALGGRIIHDQPVVDQHDITQMSLDAGVYMLKAKFSDHQIISEKIIVK